MKSMVINRFGDSSVFEEITLPIPTVTPGQVLVKIAATSVNPLDFKIRQGYFPDLVTQFPMTLHGDISGVIEQVGDGVQNFAIGDEVYGCAGGLLDLGGGLAQYLAADVNLIAHKPKSLSLIDAAALPLVALSAWEGLITYTNVQKNQTVLIHGATGGVGHIAIQLAKWLGATVFTTASSEKKLALAKALGADVAINYKETTLQAYLKEFTDNKGFEVIFDTVGGKNLAESFEAAAIFGDIITINGVGQFDLTPAFLKGLTIHTIMQPLPLITGQNRPHYHKILSKVAELVDAGIIRPLIDEKKFTVKEVGAAHKYLEQGKATGKVVLRQTS